MAGMIKVTPEQLSDALVRQILIPYAEGVQRLTSSAVEEAGTQLAEAVSKASPRHSGTIAGRSPGTFARAVRSDYSGAPITPKAVVHAGSEYPLAHLLEDGHETVVTHRDGSKTKGKRAKSHKMFSSSVDKVTADLERKLKEAVTGA